MGASRVGKSVITSIYFHDLTERIEIERQLRHANSFLQNIIRSSVDGIVVVDKGGHVLIFNEGAERILGYKAEEVIGDPEMFAKFYDPQVARENMRRMRSGDYGPPGKLSTTRITLVHKSGEKVPVNFSAAIIKEGDREVGSVGIFSDLREHLRIRRELEEARYQLLQAEKIASLGRLSAGVAHEINNPLAGILIYAEMLMKEVGDHPQWRQDLEEIIHQTLRCKQIVTRLLEFSRQPLGERVSYDMGHLAARCVELLCHQPLFHDVRFAMDLPADLPDMVGDPGQLQQVFTNLIINAANAMDGKGQITLSGRYDAGDDTVSLQFADSGPGIPPEIRDKIFEPFFTTKAPGSGTGLGLSVAYGIVQQHGGSIEAGTAPGGGALFTVILPRESPEATSETFDE
jgi:PAS domain S-box-containing protein